MKGSTNQHWAEMPSAELVEWLYDWAECRIYLTKSDTEEMVIAAATRIQQLIGKDQ